MIGGAELEPGSQMYNPRRFSVKDIHAAATEREVLAAEHQRLAADPQYVASEVQRRTGANERMAKGALCAKHSATLPFGASGVEGCVGCTRAANKVRREGPFGKGPIPDPTANEVRASLQSTAEHYHQSAVQLRQHAQARSNERMPRV